MDTRRGRRLSSSESSLSSPQTSSAGEEEDEDCLGAFSNDVKVILRKHDRKLLKVEEDVTVMVRWLHEKFGFILKQGSISSVIATDVSGNIMEEDFDPEGGGQAGDANDNDAFYEDNAEDGDLPVGADPDTDPQTLEELNRPQRYPLPNDDVGTGEMLPGHESDYEGQVREIAPTPIVSTRVGAAASASTRPQRQKPQRTSIPRRTKTGDSTSPQLLGQCQCDLCGKFLKDPNSLRQHKKIHLDIRPFTCPEPNCGKKFRRKFHLQTHSLIHKGVKKHQCGYCGRLFLLQKDLVPHEKIHTGDRPFKCRECPKEFILKSHLVMHERTHSGEKPYKCETCSKCFSQSNSLRLHKMKVHKDQNSASSSKVSKPKKKSKTPRRRKGNQGSTLTSSVIDPNLLGASSTPAPGKLPLYRRQEMNLNLSPFPHIPLPSASTPLVTFMQQQQPLPILRLRTHHPLEIFEPMNLNATNTGGIFLSPGSIIDGVSILSSGDLSTAFINSEFSEIP